LNHQSTSREQAAVQGLLQHVIAAAGFELEFSITGGFNAEPGTDQSPGQSPDQPGQLKVEFTGPDTVLLTARNGELLNAMEQLAAKVLRLESDEHDRISFDADSFKANRDREMKAAAAKAIDSVRTTGKPYAFPPMTSRERRLLHLALQESGLPTASSGEMPRRFVVLYPEGYDPATRNQPGQTYPGQPQRGQGSDASSVPVGDRVHAVRSSFRRR
jgi:spoIIIJ-associated protein